MSTGFSCRLLGLALLSVAIAGCAAQPAPDSFAELRYTHLPPIRLEAESVEVVQAYQPPAKPPNVDHQFPTPPADVAKQWVHDRLKAAGGPNRVRATVVQASVVEVPLKRSTGLRGMLTTDQSERYDGTMEMRIELLAPDGRQLAVVTSRTTRSNSVPEDITLAGREKVWFRMTEAMMNDLNASLEREIREHFADWIVR